MMPLLEISFDLFFPLCADGRAAGCFPHPGDCLADNVVVDRHALCVIFKPHSPVGRDAEAGSFLHGVHVGTEEQELPAVLLFFPLDHPADLLIAKPLAGVFQPIGISETAASEAQTLASEMQPVPETTEEVCTEEVQTSGEGAEETSANETR